MEMEQITEASKIIKGLSIIIEDIEDSIKCGDKYEAFVNSYISVGKNINDETGFKEMILKVLKESNSLKQALYIFKDLTLTFEKQCEDNLIKCKEVKE